MKNVNLGHSTVTGSIAIIAHTPHRAMEVIDYATNKNLKILTVNRSNYGRDGTLIVLQRLSDRNYDEIEHKFGIKDN